MNLIDRWLASRRVSKLLRQLGSNSREVADTLRQMGIHGDTFKHCPIDVYLQRHGFNTAVGYTSLYLVEGEKEWRFVALPYPCQQFIREFDSGYQFQDLRR